MSENTARRVVGREQKLFLAFVSYFIYLARRFFFANVKLGTFFFVSPSLCIYLSLFSQIVHSPLIFFVLLLFKKNEEKLLFHQVSEGIVCNCSSQLGRICYTNLIAALLSAAAGSIQ